MKSRRILLGFGIALIISAVFAFYLLKPPKNSLTPSRETTYLSSPVDHNGHIDYLEAINSRMAEGVTPETNAAVLIWKALGPEPASTDPLEHNPPSEYFQRLGIDVREKETTTYVSQTKYFDTHWAMSAPEKESELQNEIAQGKWTNEIFEARKRPWKKTKYPRIAQWLQDNEAALSLLAEACKRPHFYSPLIRQNKPSDQARSPLLDCYDPLQLYLSISSAFTSRAMMHLAEGAYDSAWQDLQTSHRLGCHLSKMKGFFASSMSTGIISGAIEGKIAILSEGKPSARQIRAWQKDSLTLPASRSFTEKWNIDERFDCLDLAQSIATGRSSLNNIRANQKKLVLGISNWLVRNTDWDQVLQLINKQFDEISDTYRVDSYSNRKVAFSKIEDKSSNFDQSLFNLSVADQLTMNKARRSELIAKTIIAAASPPIMTKQSSVDLFEQRLRNAKVATALALYHAENGVYPDQLTQLVPDYLDTLPIDHYSTKPMIYKPLAQGYLLYSVGPNGKDEGGYSAEPNDIDDVHIRMPPTMNLIE
jgi:hypothetical protein